MDLKQNLRSIFSRKRKCEKLVKYQGTNFKISASGSAGVVTVDLKELSKEVEKLADATSHAKLLDDFQYLLCDEVRNLPHDDDFTHLLRRYRIVIIAYLTQLGSLLEQIKADVQNIGLKQQLARLNEKMTDLVDQLRDHIIPPVKDIPKVYKKVRKAKKMPSKPKFTRIHREAGMIVLERVPRPQFAKLPWMTFDKDYINESYSKLLTASTFLGLSKEDIDELAG